MQCHGQAMPLVQEGNAQVRTTRAQKNCINISMFCRQTLPHSSACAPAASTVSKLQNLSRPCASLRRLAMRQQQTFPD